MEDINKNSDIENSKELTLDNYSNYPPSAKDKDIEIINENKLNNTDAKSDIGKLQISLVPMEIVRNIATIRMYGNNKYHSPSNWTKVEKRRYIDAMMRHLLEYLDDENAVDSESGYPALWHAACNMAFLCEMQRKDWNIRKDQIIKGFADIENK